VTSIIDRPPNQPISGLLRGWRAEEIPMVKHKHSVETPMDRPQELSDEQLADASGGFNPQPDPPKVARVLNIALPPTLVVRSGP
jgi:hypothetical protein